jgi:hypothetical protein
MADQSVVIIKAEPAILFKRKMQLMLIGMLPFIYVVFAGILKLMGEKGELLRTLWKYFPVPFIISLLVIAAAISLHWFYRSTVKFNKTPKGELEVTITNSKGIETNHATGEWSTTAFYKKEYFKYGTYQKDLFLTIYCNGEPFCLFRYKTSAAASAPEGFTESINAGWLNWNVPVFFTSETARIHRIVEQNGKKKVKDVNYYTNR